MERWVGKVAIVTGASSGIGLAIVEKLVQEGIQVVGIARRKERLDEIARKLSSGKGKFHPFTGDISKEGDILELFRWTKEHLGPISILINNAGLLYPKTIVESSVENFKSVIDVNLFGLTVCMKEAINQMRKNNIDGHIINVNSILGHKVIPNLGLSNYISTKFAVTALTQTVKLELIALGSKIKTTSLSPGLIRTELFEINSGTIDTTNHLKGMPSIDAAHVANAALYILSTPPDVQISELTIQPVGELI